MKLSCFRKVVDTFGEFIFDAEELERVKRRLAMAAFGSNDKDFCSVP